MRTGHYEPLYDWAKGQAGQDESLAKGLRRLVSAYAALAELRGAEATTLLRQLEHLALSLPKKRKPGRPPDTTKFNADIAMELRNRPLGEPKRVTAKRLAGPNGSESDIDRKRKEVGRQLKKPLGFYIQKS